MNELRAELAVFFMEFHFYLKEQMTGRWWLFRLRCLADIFLNLNEEILACQGEYRSVRIAKDKTQTSRKIEIFENM